MVVDLYQSIRRVPYICPRPFRPVVHQESAPDDPLDMSELDPEHGRDIEDF